MTTRILSFDELWRLAGTDLGRSLPWFPDGTRVIVCEDDEQIVGHLALVPMWHVEGIEVYPEHRGKGVVFRKLLEAMHVEARRLGEQMLFPAAARTDEGEQMAETILRLGAVEMPARWFALPVKES